MFLAGMFLYFWLNTVIHMKNMLLLASGLLLASCVTREMTNASTSPDAFDKFLDRYYEEYLRLNPLEATQIADNRYNDRLPNDITQEYRRNLGDFYDRYQDSLRTFDRSALSEQQQISFDILARETSFRRALLKYPDNLMPVQQFWGLALTMPQIGSGESFQPFRTAKDYDNFLRRIDAFAVWMDTAIVNMRKGLATGYTFPKILMERVLPQAEDMMVTDVTKSIFYKPILNFPDSIGETDRGRLRQAYTAAIRDKIVPAYTKLRNFLRDEYIPKTRTTAGIGDIPDGDAYYRDMIRLWTTTDLSPDSIFNLGKSEVARIRSEMEHVKDQVGFHSDLKSFFTYVSDNPKFMPFHTDEEVIDAFRAIRKKIGPRLPTLFDMRPKTAFEVKQTEAFREMSASAEYSPGAPDGSRPGIFYVPVVDPAKFNISGMETLFLHEAIPGHHYQFSLQAENKELPRFRRTLCMAHMARVGRCMPNPLAKSLVFTPIPFSISAILATKFTGRSASS